jgi:hypothetical protein
MLQIGRPWENAIASLFLVNPNAINLRTQAHVTPHSPSMASSATHKCGMIGPGPQDNSIHRFSIVADLPGHLSASLKPGVREDVGFVSC